MIEELAAALLVFMVYILVAGSLTPYDIATGLLVSAITGLVTGKYLIRNPSKILQPQRLILLIFYFFKYITIIEFKSHMDVVKRIFNMNIKPGIVKIPVTVTSEYARLFVANSITNTPGTVVIEERDGFFYVNWIDVSTKDPLEARRSISEEFETYASKILD